MLAARALYLSTLMKTHKNDVFNTTERKELKRISEL
jgi:hypothetical protein